MGRPLGSKNKTNFRTMGAAFTKMPTNPGPRGEEKLTPVEIPVASTKKLEYTALEWQVAEELRIFCGVPGCQAKNHLFGARRIIELVRA
jgi:hypothetical protein